MILNDVSPWNDHYTKSVSTLSFPDENLVRMLSRDTVSPNAVAVDLGCGSGRHIPLLSAFGYSVIGTDNTVNSLRLSSAFTQSLLQCQNTNIPIKNESIDCVCAWGSLHYCTRNENAEQINQVYRILRKDGFFYGTLRAQDDSFFSRIKNNNGSWICKTESLSALVVSFFEKNEIPGLFIKFASLQYGYCARTLLDDDRLIAHWYFRAQK